MTEPRRRWTTAEDALLWDLYQVQERAPTGKCQKINWNEIARHIPGRTNKDCRKRFYNRFTGGLRKGSWTQEEDERLFQLVERYQYRWAAIAQKMETRNADQCSKRWHHCLNPELERSPWTDEENMLLLAAVNSHGSSWKEIQRCHFPTRSANNIKNQFTILSRKNLTLTPGYLQPCCDAVSPPTSKPSSSRRPPSSSSTSASASASTSASAIASTPPLTSYASTSTPYTYGSLSSTPQLSATEYLPATPEAPALTFDMHTLGLADPACGYMPAYQASPALSFYANSPDASELVTIPDGMGMRYDFRDGLEHEHLQERYALQVQGAFGY
ncbi:SANT/Myb-like DNA-binding domain-containing protein [Aspergillus mulundensis]|uniref:Putative Myb-like transcription factor n=1 Tax=Aspergillus mulundensis TaxID=1810919 RepID=A0A3D8QZQ4_9EURO|nr:putative Myb-like transcription factor [Aspergillus mulundensis]RDW67292.1 putative Myb-like transcription factor [Aspergillus mulundensis]